MNTKILIYGTGSGAKKYYETIDQNQYKVIGFLDSDKSKEGGQMCQLPIFHLTQSNLEYEEIHIASIYSEIFFKLIAFNIDPNKIKIIYQECLSGIMTILQNSMEKKQEYVITKKMSYKKNEELDSEFIKYYDYARFKTLKLIFEQIRENNIEGCLAEVGVHRGDFAQFFNKEFPDRKMYLFDTFEGFNNSEKIYEIERGYTSKEFFESCDFKDTSTSMVLGRMINPNNCIICKGWFPQTAKDIEEKFAVVSVDVDLYLPIYEALKYFYPRLIPGGYIMLHDYNNSEFFGVKKAVKDFQENVGRLKMVPLADQGGTLIITK